VTAVLDRDTRPHTKRHSFRRRFELEMKSINSSYCCQYAMALSTKETLTDEDQQKNNVLNQESQKLDQKRLKIMTEFYGDLCQKLDDIDAFVENTTTVGKVNPHLIKAKYQADYIMAYRFRKKRTDILLSTDMDFSSLAGAECLMICRYYIKTEKVNTGNKQQQKIEKMTECYFDVGGGSNVHMQEIQEKIKKEIKNSKIQWTKVVYPVLEIKNDKL